MTNHLRLTLPAVAALIAFASGPAWAETTQSALDMLVHGTPSQRAAEARFRAAAPGVKGTDPDANTRRRGRRGAGGFGGTPQP